jgi:hypothetical protein
MSTTETIYKFGKHEPTFDDNTFRLWDYVDTGIQIPPDVVSYYKNVTNWGMMLNDKEGDCTAAGVGHMIQQWTANTDGQVTVSDAAIQEFYKHFSNGDPDAGANILDVLKYWRSTGIAGHKILAFTQLERQNRIQLMDATNLFGGAYLGLALPDCVVQVPKGKTLLDIPWVVPAKGPVGDAAPNPKNGHCIDVVGYDQRVIYVVTWGQVKTMSWPFYNAYADEAYAVLSEDWINKRLGAAPPGINLVRLRKDLAEIADVADAA